MIDLTNITLASIVITVAAGVYAFKNHTADYVDQINSTKAQIEDEYQRNRTLRNEVGILQAPSLLAQQARTHLKLDIMDPSQIAALPLREDYPPYVSKLKPSDNNSEVKADQ